MSSDNNAELDMEMDNEGHNDSFEPLGHYYTKSVTPVKLGKLTRWIMIACACVVLALSIVYSGHVKQILPFLKNWQIPPFVWVSAETVSPSAPKISMDTRVTEIPEAHPLYFRPDRFTDIHQNLPLPRPIDSPKITQLENQLASLSTRIETQQQTYTEQFKTLENQLKTMQQQASKQPVVRTAIKPHHRKPPAVLPKKQTYRPVKTKTAPRKPSVHAMDTKASVPDFTLASIDQWGDKTQAVLRHHGQLYTLVPGSTLSGWTVVEFADSHEGVYMANRQGQRRLLSLD
ncbi:hypothetical protein [Crenothrix polyspora]|uniref:Uncharacterized protein n=1 Tax=Crenothrix polyspora TaxID=360316 RepID=A0A1R4HI81_9GAMM|nr:hypothetical protein [Crenothrix polyspora]SJM95590.1 hypothetical protein CRENPOLYSF1_740002 [Crenothrix polyspora]